MADAIEGAGTTPPSTHKRCFVVSEFGTDEKTRIERRQTLKHLIKKVLEPMGYEVQRADDIDDLGQITHQIIERLIDDDLVVADLSGLNPNVFYELAVRHAARKPVITLMTHGESIPFDIKDVRTVFYDLHDPDLLEAAQAELQQKVRAIELNPSDVRNPITVARNVALLQQSDDPQEQTAGAILEAINDVRDEMRALKQRPRASVDLGFDVSREVRVSDQDSALSRSKKRRASAAHLERRLREAGAAEAEISYVGDDLIVEVSYPDGDRKRYLFDFNRVALDDVVESVLADRG